MKRCARPVGYFLDVTTGWGQHGPYFGASVVWDNEGVIASGFKLFVDACKFDGRRFRLVVPG